MDNCEPSHRTYGALGKSAGASTVGYYASSVKEVILALSASVVGAV